MATLNFVPSYNDSEIYTLAGKQLKLTTKEEFQPYLDEIKGQTGIRKLDLSGNTLGIEASRALAEAIEHHASTLEDINFADLYTGRMKEEVPVSLFILFPAMLKCPNLHIVNLSDNAFGLRTIEEIETYLAQAVSLKHLILANNGMGPFSGARIGKALYKLALAKKQTNHTSLETFICGRNRLENGSVKFLSIGLRAHENLKVVKLFQNGIRPWGIANLITQGLSNNKQLEILDLQDNTITKKASKDIAESLSQWPQLKELNLNDCMMNPLGSDLVVDALTPSIEVLKLQYNEMTQSTLIKLVSILESKLLNIKSLELNGNRLEEDSEVLEQLQELLEARDAVLDELDDLEEPDSDEEDDSEAAAEESEYEADELEKELLQEQAIYTANDKDASVDQLADELEKAHI